MPQPPDWKRVLETGMNFTEVRREQAHRIASELVSQGQLARDQLGAAVDEIVDVSRRRSEDFRTAVAAEVKRQLRVLGIAGHDGGERAAKKAATKPAAKQPAKKAAAKKSPAKQPAKKAAAKKSTAKKATTKKATAKKSTAKKATTATKPAAKRAR